MPKWLPGRAGKESSGFLAPTAGAAPSASPALLTDRESPTPAALPLADDLIRRIVAAIDEWSADNNLSNLPRKVVFEQALTIMNSLYEATATSTTGKKP